MLTVTNAAKDPSAILVPYVINPKQNLEKISYCQNKSSLHRLLALREANSCSDEAIKHLTLTSFNARLKIN
jgi:hypothetical protein